MVEIFQIIPPTMNHRYKYQISIKSSNFCTLVKAHELIESLVLRLTEGPGDKPQKR